MAFAVENNPLGAKTAVVSLLLSLFLMLIQIPFENFVSKCILMVWDLGRTACSSACAPARIMNICHRTIIGWVKKVVCNIPEQIMDEEIPEITEIDELQTFVASKKNKVWVWTVVNHWKKGILLWIIGNRSHQTFEILWQIISCWHSFWYVTDGYKVYPGYIESEDHLVSKTYMTRVEGENSRLRHYLARLHRKTFCYSKSLEMLQDSIKLLIHYLKFGTVPL